MIKVVSIVMSCFIMAQSVNIDINDIIQLDELIEHAQFHSDKYEDNFFVFISKHYGELKQGHEQEHQEEQPLHDQLPFEHQSCSHFVSAFVLIPAHKELLQLEQVADTTTNFFYQETHSLFEKQRVFQPPQFI